MLDVLEHLPSPYQPFYELFSLGAITPATIIVITTPNAASADARRDPAAWAYRHPPSHLTYFTPQALTTLLRRLRFTDIAVKGLSPAATGDVSGSAGFMVTAKGSDFQAFMHERYVPGTWSKIAAYEHLPRYRLAAPLAAGKTVLDFGCGTGYGAAMLAETAASVTGLDIDESALVWARETHRLPNLDFVRHDDAGESLPAGSFDLVTCFEMIEHVDHATQQRVIASLARLLREDGLLLISTPNPEVTALYGANPYHIREMDETELRALLSPHFPLLHILRQEVRPAVTFAQENVQANFAATSLDTGSGEPPMAFIALCGRHELPRLPDAVFFDDAISYVGDFMARAKAVQAARTDAYNQSLRANATDTQLRIVTGERNMALNRMNQALHEKSAMENARNEMEANLIRKTQAMEALARQRTEELRSPRFLARHLWHAVRDRLRQKPGKS
jgi:2-polyprenyl-3-methyl-5-hydroxy-6-metoxy-1,4-benzoquinol methylase